MRVKLVPSHSPSNLGVAQRWFRSVIDRSQFQRSYYFTDRMAEVFEKRPEDFMLIKQQRMGIGWIPEVTEYRLSDGFPLAVVEEKDSGYFERQTCISGDWEVPDSLISRTEKLPAPNYGLRQFVEVMRKYESAQKLLYELGKRRDDLLVRGGFPGEKPEYRLLQMFDKGRGGGIFINTPKAFYPSEPYDVYWLFESLRLQGLLEGKKSGIDLGCGLGMVTLMMSIFLDQAAGIDKRPEFFPILKEVLRDPVPLLGQTDFREGDFLKLGENLACYDVIFIFSFDGDWLPDFQAKIKRYAEPNALLIENKVIDAGKKIFAEWPGAAKFIGDFSFGCGNRFSVYQKI